MPYAPPTVCCKASCGKQSYGRYCADHTEEAKREANKRIDAGRGSSSKRGYGYRWQKYCKRFLARPENALCSCGCFHPSTVVDHIVPHKGDQKLFWLASNHQGMAKRCHDAKTAREDGGFGNKSKAGVGGQISTPFLF